MNVAQVIAELKKHPAHYDVGFIDVNGIPLEVDKVERNESGDPDMEFTQVFLSAELNEWDRWEQGREQFVNNYILKHYPEIVMEAYMQWDKDNKRPD